ncbi:MAG: thiamine pyrophosphokinase [Paracoccaceae bacterium]|jgi:thiamine pyrophosphokinase
MQGDPAPLVFDAGLLLVGGAPLPRGAIAEVGALTRAVVAADGGADQWLAEGLSLPDAVIGDMDSVADPAAWRARLGPRFIHLTDQMSTDLEKCLRLTRAPLTVGVGFLDGRLDHSLAALHALMRHPGRVVVLLGDEDAVALLPPRWTMAVDPGARISLFPMVPVRATGCAGLEWPVTGMAFRPGTWIGTSNRAVGAAVAVSTDAPGMIALVARRFLPQLLDSLTAPDAGRWG